jgi:RNA polymerase sigma-70 factor (ECF subfamily)
MSAEVNIDRVNRLFDGWYGVLVSYAARLTGSSSLAEDVVQEAFYLLYRELESGKIIGNEKAWTFCVVRREVGRQVYRRRKHEISLESPELRRCGALTVQEGLSVRDDLSGLFSLLSPREEEVLLLCMETLKYKEIGDALGISHNTVATMHRRAIRKLRSFLGLGGPPYKFRKEATSCGENIAPIKTSLR